VGYFVYTSPQVPQEIVLGSFTALNVVTGNVRSCSTKGMGFALWVDTQSRLAWAQGTHEYRPMGTAVIAITDQFRHRDFHQMRRGPVHLRNSFAGFFGSLEEVNGRLRSRSRWKLRVTPSHVR